MSFKGSCNFVSRLLHIGTRGTVDPVHQQGVIDYIHGEGARCQGNGVGQQQFAQG